MEPPGVATARLTERTLLVLPETIKVIHGAQIPSEPLEEVTAPPTEQTRLVLPETTKATHGAQIRSGPLEEATAAHAEPTHLVLSGVITEDRPETTFDRQALRAPPRGSH